MEGYELSEMGRQMANLIRIGTVAELDQTNARVRVNTSGLTTDWLPWAASRAGNTRTWSPPRVGEQVVIASPFGDMAQAVVIGSLFSDSKPAPASSQDQETTVYPDGSKVDYNSATSTLTVDLGTSKITATKTQIQLKVGDVTLSVSSGGVAIVGGQVTHNGKNIGDTHTHIGSPTAPNGPRSATGAPN